MPDLVVRRWSVGLVVGVAATLGSPAVASAAVAPVRTIGIDPSGARTPWFTVQAASLDGSKIVGFDDTPEGNFGLVLRDVAAGTSTRVLDSFEFPTGFSNDLTWIT